MTSFIVHDDRDISKKVRYLANRYDPINKRKSKITTIVNIK